MKVTEPISRKLMHFGRVYMHALAKQVHHLDINTQTGLSFKLGPDE